MQNEKVNKKFRLFVCCLRISYEFNIPLANEIVENKTRDTVGHDLALNRFNITVGRLNSTHGAICPYQRSFAVRNGNNAKRSSCGQKFRHFNPLCTHSEPETFGSLVVHSGPLKIGCFPLG